MPLRPEYQDTLPQEWTDMDDFFEQLTSIKNTNLENLRNSVVDAPNQPVMPQEKNPNKMEDAKAEIVANKIIASEREDAWAKWRSKRDMEKVTKNAPLFIGAYILYKFFL